MVAIGKPSNKQRGFIRLRITRLAYGPKEWISVLVALFSVATVFWALGPKEIFLNTTPTGGDMGAHVWGPAFLRDELLPSLQLRGWTSDWYAGFPAMHFYMVLPYLMIVFLDLLVPYGVAFKLVAISGVCFMPLAAWKMARLSNWKEPLPALMAIGALLFVFDSNFTIYGGNVASMLAGEFAFSIGLAVALIYLGLVNQCLHMGRFTARAAVALAIVALCHPITLLFSVSATVVLILARSIHSLPKKIGSKPTFVMLSLGLLAPAVAFIASSVNEIRFVFCLLPVLCLLLVDLKVSVKAVLMGLWAAALSAFWTVPFLLRHRYLNDMGWERLDEVVNNLFFPERLPGDSAKMPITWVLVLAAVAVVVGAIKWHQPSIALTVMAVASGCAFVLWPQHRLWNARLLPFWYLSLYLLAAVGVWFLIEGLFSSGSRANRNYLARRQRFALLLSPILIVLAASAFVAVHLGIAPGGSYNSKGSFRWGPFTVSAEDANFVSGWAAWNFGGYESRDGYPRYRSLIATMNQVGKDYGCGRSLWEYDKQELGSYGTPMAPMLLPYWTEGCIGSMEGLYFESSATVPFHFLMQSELSLNPSRPMRGLDYRGLDLEAGLRHLQMSGVRYYIAFSEEAKEQAQAHPDVVELLAVSEPWHVYRVAGSELVEGLKYVPNVSTAGNHGVNGWTKPAVAWFTDETRAEIVVTGDGPEEWPRVSITTSPFLGQTKYSDSTLEPLPPVVISEIEESQDGISFSVDRPGVPVLVKTSYFPNWSVSGAEGPYRATPNWMVVIPTEQRVHLEFGATWVEYFGWFLTLSAVGGLVYRSRFERRKISA